MGTKTQITTKIDTDLASASTIPISTHRGVLHGSTDSVVDNFYSLNVQNDSNATTNVFTEADSGITYNVVTNKQGGRVNMNGFMQNQTGAVIGAQTEIMSITTTEYEQESTAYYFTGISATDGRSISFALRTNTIKALGAIGISEIVRFNTLTYNTSA